MQSPETLFASWQQELNQRENLRAIKSLQGWVLSSADDCELLYRALYYTGRRYEFAAVLFDNLDHNLVLKWLSTGRRQLLEYFFRYAAWKLCTAMVKPEKIQFLINLFSQELTPVYIPIINVLNPQQCRFLMARTANPQLRDLLKEREQRLKGQYPTYIARLLDEGQAYSPYPTLHGDKNLLLQEAGRNAILSSQGRFEDPFGPERFRVLLDFCDSLYACGLLDDALLVLRGAYTSYQDKNRLVSILDDSRIFKRFTRLNRSLLPLVILQGQPSASFSQVTAIWNACFKRLPPDYGSLYYLELYSSIREGFIGQNRHSLWEILYKSDLIRLHRPQDEAPLKKVEVEAPFGQVRIKDMLHIIRERMGSRPHESFVLLEMLRLLYHLEKISRKFFPATEIIDIYLDLWNWHPHRLFFNKGLVDQLSPLINGQQRQRINRMVQALKSYDLQRTRMDLQNRPDFFKNKNALIQRQILLGHVLGVLN